MRDNVKAFVKDVTELFEIPEPVYEFGSLQVAGQEGYADLRPLFPGKRFVGCDVRMGVGVDRIEDLMALSLDDESVGTILILDTLEHVENCHKAMDEVHRVLQPRGLLLMSSVMLFPIHEYPSDYWRFTPEGFRLLLRQFTTAAVSYEGEPEIPHTVFGLASKSQCADDAMTEYLKRRKAAESTGFPRLFSVEQERTYWREHAGTLQQEVELLSRRLEEARGAPIGRVQGWLDRIGLGKPRSASRREP